MIDGKDKTRPLNVTVPTAEDRAESGARGWEAISDWMDAQATDIDIALPNIRTDADRDRRQMAWAYRFAAEMLREKFNATAPPAPSGGEDAENKIAGRIYSGKEIRMQRTIDALKAERDALKAELKQHQVCLRCHGREIVSDQIDSMGGITFVAVPCPECGNMKGADSE